MMMSETETRIPCKDTADFDADILLRIDGDRIFITVDDIRGRGGRGYLTPDQARQTAAALVRIATTLAPLPSGTEPGAVDIERYAVAGRKEAARWAGMDDLPWKDRDSHECYLAIARGVALAVLADHAADLGKLPPRLTDHVKALAHLHSALDGLDMLPVDSSDVTEHITTALDYLAPADPGERHDRVERAVQRFLSVYDDETATEDDLREAAYALGESLTTAPDQPTGTGPEGVEG